MADKVSGFDIMKAVSDANGKIYLAPIATNLIRAHKTKHGTEITIGIGMDCVAGLLNGAYVGGLILVDKVEWDAANKKLEGGA